MRISKGLGDLSDETLRFYRQVGVEEVGLPGAWTLTPRGSRPHVPPAQRGPAGRQAPVWDVAELRRMRERAAEFELDATAKSLGISGAVLLGQPERAADLETIRHSIRAAAEAGITVLTYSFTALRASEGYYALDGEGRGGAHLRAFDNDRIKDLPPLETVGVHTREQMWERLTHFLESVIPTAEACGVQLALHPNDPPVEEYRGVAQPVRSLADLQRVVEAVDSPANCIYLDTGVLTEMGENAAEAIRWFGSRRRIGTVHFRNVIVERPYDKYIETFLDAGECDMAACMRAFAEVGYEGGLDPDHTPGFDGDTVDTHVGWAYAIGQMIGLRAAALSERGR